MTFMNSTCNSIGMKSSFFGNPHGLPHPKSGSTAEDVAIVINEALRFPFFREVIKTK
jgi:D-alanyl-D-alanine carboxypeptidase (penicillin-binding protein 5/6)